jgi:S1-C subfamily serine protease
MAVMELARPLRALGVLVIALSPHTASGAHLSVQEAVLRAKPAVALVVSEVAADVRLDCGSGETRVAPTPFRETGTGWIVHSHGYLVTNAHVVQPAYSTPIWIINSLTRKAVEAACVPLMLAKLGIEPGERPDIEEELKRQAFEVALPTATTRVEPAVFVVLSSGARLQADVKKYSPPVAGSEMSGRDLALLRIGARDLPVLPLGDSRTAQIGDPVHILGFPGVVLSHELLNATAKVEASVTNGAISGFKEDVGGNPVIQTDAPAAWGNSGGPAVDLHGQVTGVLTFVSLAPGAEGSIVQGFNFIIPSSLVRDFLDGTGVDLGATSPFNDAWYAGLRDFFDQRYRRAARRFEAADKIQPGLPDVKRLLADASSRPTPIPWGWIAGAIAGISLAGVAGISGLRWQHTRYRINPSQVVALMEGPNPPLILDVRASASFARSPLVIPNSIRVSPEELRDGVAALPVRPDQTVVAYCT